MCQYTSSTKQQHRSRAAALFLFLLVHVRRRHITLHTHTHTDMYTQIHTPVHEDTVYSSRSREAKKQRSTCQPVTAGRRDAINNNTTKTKKVRLPVDYTILAGDKKEGFEPLGSIEQCVHLVGSAQGNLAGGAQGGVQAFREQTSGKQNRGWPGAHEPQLARPSESG